MNSATVLRSVCWLLTEAVLQSKSFMPAKAPVVLITALSSVIGQGDFAPGERRCSTHCSVNALHASVDYWKNAASWTSVWEGVEVGDRMRRTGRWLWRFEAVLACSHYHVLERDGIHLFFLELCPGPAHVLESWRLQSGCALCPLHVIAPVFMPASPFVPLNASTLCLLCEDVQVNLTPNVDS